MSSRRILCNPLIGSKEHIAYGPNRLCDTCLGCGLPNPSARRFVSLLCRIAASESVRVRITFS